ncbi:MAG: hypothetical protein P4M11_10500 [Candidatus Pacebacteria bacterium]|nr:hypothetical protein [Candidatus Paceibacterota bacterium]
MSSLSDSIAPSRKCKTSYNLMTKNSLPNPALPERFIQALRKAPEILRLDNDEAQVMRERLIAYADLHEASAGAAKPRQHSGLTLSPWRFTSAVFYSRAFVAGILILVLVVGTGAGITYAAGNSLPGQPLYPIKVNVAEPIEGAVIATTKGTAAAATWQNTLAERRLTEATTLAAQNKLATSTQVYLEDQAAQHVAQSENDSSKLAAAGNAQAAASVRTDLAARLAAHAQLLAIIAPRLAEAGYATSTSQVIALLDNVNQAQATVSLNRDREVESPKRPASSFSKIETSTSTSTIAIAATAMPTPAFEDQERHFFNENVHILSLLPPATTTASTTSPSDFHEMHHGSDGSGDMENTGTTTATTTVTATSTPDSPSVKTPYKVPPVHFDF